MALDRVPAKAHRVRTVLITTRSTEIGNPIEMPISVIQRGTSNAIAISIGEVRGLRLAIAAIGGVPASESAFAAVITTDGARASDFISAMAGTTASVAGLSAGH